MLLTLHFIIGLVTSFIGMLTPSMLNMTAAKISLENGKAKALQFAIGASIVVFLQASLATIFTQYLREHPMFIDSLQKIALVIFALLSIYFYRQYKKDQLPKLKSPKQKLQNKFSIGLLLSALNMFAIPFYCGITTALDAAGWFRFTPSYVLMFVLGSTIGTFLLLYMYLNYATLVQSKAKGLTKNMNLILAILTSILAIVTAVKTI